MNLLKRALTGLSAATLLMGSVATASAIDIRNEDDRAYPVTIVSSSMTRDMNLTSLTMSIVVCVGECEFRVAGVGATKARGNDTVTIRNGRFVVERVTAEASSAKPKAARGR